MATTELSVNSRAKAGKGISRSLRRSGLIPAVVYGPGMEPCPISVDPKELTKAIATDSGWNTLITLKGDGPFDGKQVILKELVCDPIRNDAQHADFHAVNLTQKVHVLVPVHPVGKSIGEKEGGNLEVIRHELEVICLPTAIPQAVEIDVSDMKVGDVLHVSEIQLPDGVELPQDVNFTVLTCTGHKPEAVEEVEGEEEEAGESEEE